APGRRRLEEPLDSEDLGCHRRRRGGRPVADLGGEKPEAAAYPSKVDSMVAQMSKVASSRAVAVVGAGAVLANPGGFIPLALKAISETDPTAVQYLVEWVFFTLVSLLPLAVALLMLLVSRDWAKRQLGNVRDWLITNARSVAAVIIVLLALPLLRNGISGLVG